MFTFRIEAAVVGSIEPPRDQHNLCWTWNSLAAILAFFQSAHETPACSSARSGKEGRGVI